MAGSSLFPSEDGKVKKKVKVWRVFLPVGFERWMVEVCLFHSGRNALGSSFT